MITRRRFVACSLAASLASFAAPSFAQDDYPNRPVTIVAPFPAGSVTDAVTRTLAQALQQSLGQPIVVENRAGAQGTIGAAHVANARPDGYTLLMGSSVMFVARSLIKTLPYDPVKSFAPVSGIGSTAMMFLVQHSSPLQSVADLTSAARHSSRPISMGYGSPSGQVAVALFSTITDSTPTAVSYRGIPQAITDLVGGQVDVAVVDLGNGLVQVKSGKARALAISAAARYAGAPDVPTLQESFPDASGSLETIIAVMAPAGTPVGTVARLDTAIQAALATDRVRDQFRTLNTTVLPLTAAQLATRIATDNPRWESLMRKAGIEAQ